MSPRVLSRPKEVYHLLILTLLVAWAGPTEKRERLSATCRTQNEDTALALPPFNAQARSDMSVRHKTECVRVPR